MSNILFESVVLALGGHFSMHVNVHHFSTAYNEIISGCYINWHFLPMLNVFSIEIYYIL